MSESDSQDYEGETTDLELTDNESSDEEEIEDALAKPVGELP